MEGFRPFDMGSNPVGSIPIDSVICVIIGTLGSIEDQFDRLEASLISGMDETVGVAERPLAMQPSLPVRVVHDHASILRNFLYYYLHYTIRYK